MKRENLLLIVLILITGIAAKAQINLPAASPTATLSQSIGLTDVMITYSRPGAKDRKIFGDLVPYGKLWRTGANMASKIEFADDVTIEGNKVPGGAYALFTIPGESEWTIILNKNYHQGGTGQYNEAEDQLRFKVKPSKYSEFVETFTITINNVQTNSADVQLIWENTKVSFKVETDVDSKVMADIDNAFNVSANEYYLAATYYFESKKDLNKALEWINEAIKLYEKDERNVFWVYRTKALIQAGLKDYKSAIATAELAKKKAQEAKNDDYVRLNEKSIQEWTKL